jgi:hypothetical protein
MASNHTHTHDEEALIATLLANGVSALTPSVAECPECTKIAQDILRLTEGLAGIEDEEPPPLRLEELRGTRQKLLGISWIEDFSGDWYRNPFVLSFGFLMFVIVMYFLIAFILR